MNPLLSSRPADAARPCRFAASDPDWRRDLPADWQAAVQTPLHFRRWQEYEMPARREIGYDEDDAPCYYRHRFLLESLYEEDDDLHVAIVYGEEVAAWRLRDGRWLVWRLERQPSQCAAGRGFYSFSERRPG